MKTVDPTTGIASRAVTLCVACLLGMAGGLMSGDAWAGQTIDNTASVSFRLQAGRSDTVMLKSNTVRIDVLPTPTPAVAIAT